MLEKLADQTCFKAELKLISLHKLDIRGWTAQQKAMMEAIVLPKRLRCYDFSKLTNVSGFSERQCKDPRYGIITRKVNAAKLDKEAWLRCHKCTDVQPTEMECIICETVKGHWVAATIVASSPTSLDFPSNSAKTSTIK